MPPIDLPMKEDRRAVARERHGLFRCGAFAAARVRRPSIQNIRERYSDHSPRPRIPGRLTSCRLLSSAPHLGFLSARSTYAQQCCALATYRSVSCLSASTICGCITAHRSDDWRARRAGALTPSAPCLICRVGWYQRCLESAQVSLGFSIRYALEAPACPGLFFTPAGRDCSGERAHCRAK